MSRKSANAGNRPPSRPSPDVRRQEALLKTGAPAERDLQTAPNFSIIATDEKGHHSIVQYRPPKRMLGYSGPPKVVNKD